MHDIDTWGRGVAGHALIGLAAVLSTWVFFRHQIDSGFTSLSSDRFDGLIGTTILEHWYNVFRGRDAWDTAKYFYPHTANLGYNESFFLFGVIYSLFRRVGLDVLISTELANIALKLIGFYAFYALSRRSFSITFGFSVLGAVIFTISCGSYEQVYHAQLLGVAIAPLFLLCVERHLSLTSLSPIQAAVFGCAAALTLDVLLLTTFYMAWFTVLFVLTAAVIAGLRCRINLRALTASLNINRLWPSFLAGAVFVVGVLPFLLLYLPKAVATGMHPWDVTKPFLPSVFDVVNVGPGNLLFGLADAALNHAVRPAFPVYGEHTVGVPPILLTLFVIGLLSLHKNMRVATTGIACLVIWLFALHIGSFSLWRLIYVIVPGAGAVRVVCRMQIFLVVPIVLVVTSFLSASRRRLPKPLLLALCFLLVAEQIDSSWVSSLSRPVELQQLASIPPIPQDCRVFYASTSRRGLPLYSAELDGAYSLNVDAMLIAEIINVSTVNGMASFIPADWTLAGTQLPDYRKRVQGYLNLHHISRACELDIRAFKWREARAAE